MTVTRMQSQPAEEHRPHVRRIIIICLIVLAGAYFMSWRNLNTDFAQDYAAAWAWWHGMNPNGSVREIFALCCEEDPNAVGIYELPTAPAQTAHPPAATVLALPFALLPFRVAQVAWMVVSTVAVGLGWYLARVPERNYLAALFVFMLGLSMGILEPFLFGLLAGALWIMARRPLLAGALIGLAAAIKVYPVLLLGSLLLLGRWRMLLVAGCTGGLVTLASSALIGHNALFEWLHYTQLNTLFYVDAYWQKSPVRLLRWLMPGFSSLAGTLLVATLMFLPLIPALRRSQDPIRPMLPVMLLSSPLLWTTYTMTLTLGWLGTVERVCLVLAGLSGVVMRLALVESTPLHEAVNIVLVVTPIVLVWLRWVMHGWQREHTTQPLPPTGG